MSIGQQLRQRREEQGLSLDQASQVTHIRLHYLEALEADQFDRLPSSTQLRGFLRAYGEYLKLNPSELLQSLEGSLKASPVAAAPLQPAGVASVTSSGSDTIFKDLGQKLRRQRELMGLSLGDVERHTHLRMHYVRALEEGDIAHLPSPVQGRGMLSNYASFLGLNTEEVLLHFADGLQASLYDRQAAKRASGPRSSADESGRIPARPSQLRRLFSMDLFAGGFLIIFLLGFTIWGAMRISALHSGQEPSPTAPPVSEILLSTQDETPSIATSPLPTGISSAAPTSIGATLPLTATLPAMLTETPIIIASTPGASNAPVQVYIIAHQRAWMRLTVDGELAFEGRVMPGSAYSFNGNERIEFLSGDGASLQVYFNQQDLGVLGTYGEVVQRIFSIEGIQTATPGILPTSTSAPSSTPQPSATTQPTKPTATPTVTPRP